MQSVRPGANTLYYYTSTVVEAGGVWTLEIRWTGRPEIVKELTIQTPVFGEMLAAFPFTIYTPEDLPNGIVEWKGQDTAYSTLSRDGVPIIKDILRMQRTSPYEPV